MCNEKGRSALRLITPFLLLSYPFAVHLGVLFGQLWPALLILSLLLLIPLWQHGALLWRLLGSAVIAALLLVPLFTPLEQGELIYAIPTAIVLLFWVMFARTLLPGQTPLVSRAAELIHGKLSPRLRRYTRGVTWAWVVFFTAMLVETVWLALYASAEIWSLFTNFINYLMLAAFFLLEFALRRFVLSPEERLGFIAFFRAMSRIDLRRLSRQ